MSGPMVDLVIEVEYRGSITVRVPKKDAESFVDEVEDYKGSMDVDAIPFTVDWNDFLNAGDGVVEGSHIRPQRIIGGGK